MSNADEYEWMINFREKPLLPQDIPHIVLMSNGKFISDFDEKGDLTLDSDLTKAQVFCNEETALEMAMFVKENGRNIAVAEAFPFHKRFDGEIVIGWNDEIRNMYRRILK